MARDDATDGPPAKKARPTSVEDVVVQRAAGQHKRRQQQQQQKQQQQGPPGAKAAGRGMLTLEEIAGDRLTQLAAKHWSEAARAKEEQQPFEPQLVQQIYKQELGGGRDKPPLLRRVMLLEVSQYLEGYLWPHFDPATASDAHVMSIAVMVNEKFREGVPAWTAFHSRQEVFPGFFSRLLALRLPERWSQLAQHEATAYLLFMINAFQSLEDEMVRPQALRLVSLPIWHGLSHGRLQLELAAQPALAKRWKALLKKEAKAAAGGGKSKKKDKGKAKAEDAAAGDAAVADAEGTAAAAAAAAELPRAEASFLPGMIQEFLSVLRAADAQLAGQQQQQQPQAAAEAEAEADEEDEEEEEEEQEGEDAAAEAEVEPAAADNALTTAEDAAAAAAAQNGHQQQGGKQQQQSRKQQQARKQKERNQRKQAQRMQLRHLERFVEWLIDLLSQLPTRRFVHALLEDQQLLVKARRSALYSSPGGKLLRQLLDLLAFYCDFPLNDHTGEQLKEDDVVAGHYDKVSQLQRLFFKHWPQLYDLALANCAAACAPDGLRRALRQLAPQELVQLVCRQLRLVGEDDPWAQDPDFLLDVLVSTYQRRASQRAAINAMPIYPTEGLLWDTTQIPTAAYSGGAPLALPKLNLQFLSPSDYLLRNFHLFRLEAAYEVREDIEAAYEVREDIEVALQRLNPGRDFDDNIVFSGWSKMATPLTSFRITQVSAPRVGEAHPASVLAEVVVDTRGMRGDVASGWDELKQHDVLFLMGVNPPNEQEAAEAAEAARLRKGQPLPLVQRVGLLAVRGAEVVEVRDEEGGLMNDFTGRVRLDERKPPKGFVRTYVVALDAAQYQLDVNATASGDAPDVYPALNVVMRRDAKENNFKAVLESIRDSLNEQLVIPEWLVDIFLGYGDAGAAHYSAMPGLLRTVDFKDTFLDAQHLIDCFPQYDVTFSSGSSSISTGSGTYNAAALPPPPYKVTFPSDQQQLKPAPGSTKRGADAKATTDVAAAAVAAADGSSSSSSSSRPVLLVEHYKPINMGPYPEDKPKGNDVRFTSVQVEAVAAGVQPGLTMVVGPPGTGKTDTAVQILQVLYHNCPGQRTLLITHSNQALNDLFEKMVARDIPARYLLRLGMGERDLNVDDDFSRAGRVNNMLARRLTLLAEVEKLSNLLGVPHAEYTCETAGYFWLLHVLSRWEKFTAAVSPQQHRGVAASVGELFPFKEFFADAPQPLFKGSSYEEDMEVAQGCFRHLRLLFQELEETRPFELLKGQADRVSYLCNKQAKVVAMTCTHAALKRREFLNLGLKYDNIVMEEAGQVLEVETFIPMVLQRQEDGVARLKRVILIGDHHQLPPVVQNMAFQKYSRLDQSLFARFIRLGTPYVELNAQGRARPSIAALYNWRYGGLKDLPAVTQNPAFLAANPGFGFDFQLVNVPDYNGKGESEPAPYYYQNLGEAEYVVAVYSFMRLLGYPASKISILTTYNGQKDLLRDVVEARCANHPLIGRPHKITTVDKYQGQQNDYVLLSLVRSRIVGHLRDVRRLVVALSRARLGLYVFGRQELFANCFELAPAFSKLLERPTQLALVKGEAYASCKRALTDKAPLQLIGSPQEMMSLVAAVSKEQAAAAAAAAVPPPRPPPGTPPAAAAAAVPPPRPPPGAPPSAAAGAGAGAEGEEAAAVADGQDSAAAAAAAADGAAEVPGDAEMTDAAPAAGDAEASKQ
uniref:Uncharacterized protein n=1 Tax=Tetradesmus obliquus TaxID=3088 RepID=A0A383WJ31_TETOB